MARQPKNPFHPGEILLEEFLEPKGVTQAAFAEKIGWTKTRLNELIKGKRGITAAAALDLSDALGTSPKLWMNLQATFDLDKESAARRVAFSHLDQVTIGRDDLASSMNLDVDDEDVLQVARTAIKKNPPSKKTYVGRRSFRVKQR